MNLYTSWAFYNWGLIVLSLVLILWVGAPLLTLAIRFWRFRRVRREIRSRELSLVVGRKAGHR